MNKTKNRANLAFTVILIIGIAVVINLFSYRIFYRWDISQNKEYSVSQATKNSLGQMDDVATIKVYFSSNLPSQYLGLKQGVNDILDEYQRYAHGKISVEQMNPKSDDDTEQALATEGIPALQFNIMDKDKYQVTKGFMGLVITYGGKKEVIPVIQELNNLEYQLTMALKKLATKDLPTLGYVTSNGAIVLNGEAAKNIQQLRGLYNITEVDLKKNNIGADIKTLLIAGPKENFTKEELKKIDDFLMSGRSVLILADGVTVGNNLTATVNNTNLNELLEKYGVRLNNDLVLDVYSGRVSFSQGFMSFLVDYPFWPKIVKDGFNSTNPAVARLSGVVLPWASSIDILQNSQDEKIDYLARTSNQGWLQTKDFTLNPQNIPAVSNTKSYNLAVALSGNIKSAFGDKTTDQGRLIVVGDSDFMRDQFGDGTNENAVFFQNLVDNLAMDNTLATIRSKSMADRQIKELSDNGVILIRYANVFGVTILVLGFGLWRYFKRKNNQ